MKGNGKKMGAVKIKLERIPRSSPRYSFFNLMTPPRRSENLLHFLKEIAAAHRRTTMAGST
jgi:hypothetical protein